MKKLHGLVISWYYPPVNSSEGLVTYKLLKNSNFTYDVFTRKPQTNSENIWDRDVEESELTADNVTIYQSEADNEKEWVDEAVRFFEQHADEYDFVMSRIMSKDAHVAAARIKNMHPEIFWIASFGDPLVDSPYLEIIKKRSNPFFLKQYYVKELPSFPKLLRLAISPTRIARKKVWEKERIEKMIFPNECKAVNDETFEKADLLVFNNQQQYDLAFSGEKAKYQPKGVVVFHSFDKSLYPKTVEPKNDNKIHFVYVGHLDSLRNAKSVFDALGMMKKNDSLLSEKVHFDFYGHIDDMDKVAIVDNEIADLVSLHKNITYLESLKKMKEADWLIMIDANLNKLLDEYIYLPAKLMDYFGAGKNIFAITQLRGTTADAMKKTRAGKVVTHCASDVALYLSKIIYQNYNPAKRNEKSLSEYDAVNVAKMFDEMVLDGIQKEQKGC